MRFALEHQNPLVSTRVTGGGSAFPPNEKSFLTLGSSDVLLWALKPAEEGIATDGVIARVWNVADAQRSMSLALPAGGILSARRLTHIETDIGPVQVTDGILTDLLERQQMRTYRLFGPTGPLATGPDVGAASALSVFPNPAPTGTPSTVSYSLPTAGSARVTVHDVAGKVVATLADGVLAAGTHRTRWDGRAANGRTAAPGIYFVRVEAGGVERMGKIVRLR
jgi:hypothetical protein